MSAADLHQHPRNGPSLGFPCFGHETKRNCSFLIDELVRRHLDHHSTIVSNVGRRVVSPIL